MLPELSPEQSLSMFLAIVVRNAMENFHVKYLTDAQMAELNPIIRNAIYTALVAGKEAEHNERAGEYIAGERRMIPSYWEPPQLLEDYVYLVSDKFQEDLDRLLGRKRNDQSRT